MTRKRTEEEEDKHFDAGLRVYMRVLVLSHSQAFCLRVEFVSTDADTSTEIRDGERERQRTFASEDSTPRTSCVLYVQPCPTYTLRSRCLTRVQKVYGRVDVLSVTFCLLLSVLFSYLLFSFFLLCFFLVGKVFRLYTEETFRDLAPRKLPEIFSCDVDQIYLELKVQLQTNFSLLLSLLLLLLLSAVLLLLLCGCAAARSCLFSSTCLFASSASSLCLSSFELSEVVLFSSFSFPS